MIQIVLLVFLSTFSLLSNADDIFIDAELSELQLHPRIIHQEPIEAQVGDTALRSPDPLIDLAFGQLSLVQYDGLMAYYRNLSRVKYDANRSYYLSDFLSPQMQALRGLDFNSKETAIDIKGFRSFIYDDIESKEEIYSTLSTAQCWGTAWNNIVSFQNEGREPSPFEIGFIDSKLVKKNILSSKYSVPVKKGDNFKFGDLLALQSIDADGIKTPVHFPIYIGFGLVFEKEDAEFGTPYRILLYKDSLKGLTEAIESSWRHNGEQVAVFPRRFLDVDKPKLPKPSRINPALTERSYEKFGRIAARMMYYSDTTTGGANVPGVEVITKVSFGIDENGRGYISNKAKTLFSPAYKALPLWCSELEL